MPGGQDFDKVPLSDMPLRKIRFFLVYYKMDRNGHDEIRKLKNFISVKRRTCCKNASEIHFWGRVVNNFLEIENHRRPCQHKVCIENFLINESIKLGMPRDV